MNRDMYYMSHVLAVFCLQTEKIAKIIYYRLVFCLFVYFTFLSSNFRVDINHIRDHNDFYSFS